MGPAEIVGFAVCWVFAAVVLTWGVLTERRRGPVRRSRARSRRAARPVPQPAAEPPVELAVGSGWVVVESLPGSGPDVRAEGDLIVAAALAARGVEVSALALRDQRTEVFRTPDRGEVTRFLLRAEVLTPAEPA